MYAIQAEKKRAEAANKRLAERTIDAQRASAPVPRCRIPRLNLAVRSCRVSTSSKLKLRFRPQVQNRAECAKSALWNLQRTCNMTFKHQWIAKTLVFWRSAVHGRKPKSAAANRFLTHKVASRTQGHSAGVPAAVRLRAAVRPRISAAAQHPRARCSRSERLNPHPLVASGSWRGRQPHPVEP